MSWMSDTAAYWKYDLAIPKYCHSKKTFKQSCCHKALLAGINCTKDQLPDIENDRTDVKHGGWSLDDVEQDGVWDGNKAMFNIKIK